MKFLNILCEGQTEESFVKRVMKEYVCSSTSFIVKTRLLTTSRKKKTSGGMLSYTQVKNDLSNWRKEVAFHQNEEHFFTTMFDLYALPNDFPGYEEASKIPDAYQRVEKIEASLKEDIDCANFIPYIQLHEFESLLFCDIMQLKELYPNSQKKIKELEGVLHQFHDNPELINHDKAPSKRIIEAINRIINTINHKAAPL